MDAGEESEDPILLSPRSKKVAEKGKGLKRSQSPSTSGDDDEEPTAPCLSHVEPSEILVPQPQTQTRRQKRGREEDTGPEAAGPSTKVHSPRSLIIMLS